MILLVWLSMVGLALIAGWYVAVGGQTLLLACLGFFFLVLFIFKTTEEYLPIILVLTLALGSAYRYDIAIKSFYLRFLVLGLIALRSTFQIILSRRDQAKLQSFSLVHLCFLLIGIYGVSFSFNSVDPSLSAQRAASFILLYVVTFFYFWKRTEHLQDCEKYLISLWKTTGIILTVGWLFFFIRVPGMSYGGRLRLILGNPNQLGNYCAMMSPIAFWYWKEKMKGKLKTLGFVVLIMMAVALIASGSRAGLVGAVLAMFLLTFFCYRKQLALFTMIVTMVGLVHFLFSDSSKIERQGNEGFIEQTILRESQLSTGSGRTDIWKAAMRLVHERPYFGFGFGIVDRLFNMGYFPELPTFQGGHVHNSYIEELVNLGWIGSFPFFIALFYILLVGVKFSFLENKINLDQYKLGISLFAMICSALISSVFESWFTSVGSVFCFPFWFGVVLFLRVDEFSKRGVT